MLEIDFLVPYCMDTVGVKSPGLKNSYCKLSDTLMQIADAEFKGWGKTSTAGNLGARSQKKLGVENWVKESEEMVAAPKQLGVIPGSSSQSSHNALGLKEPIGPRRRPAGPYKYCIRARLAS